MAQVITANRLRDGLVVFFADAGWVEGIDAGADAGNVTLLV